MKCSLRVQRNDCSGGEYFSVRKSVASPGRARTARKNSATSHPAERSTSPLRRARADLQGPTLKEREERHRLERELDAANQSLSAMRHDLD